jgi:hypothetical protein
MLGANTMIDTVVIQPGADTGEPSVAGVSWAGFCAGTVRRGSLSTADRQYEQCRLTDVSCLQIADDAGAPGGPERAARLSMREMRAP